MLCNPPSETAESDGMTRNENGPANGKGASEPDTGIRPYSLLLGIAGFAILYLGIYLGIAWVPDATADFLGPVSAGLSDDPFFILGFMLAGFSLLLPRMRGWKRRVAFIAASVPFAIYFVAAGTAAALLEGHLSRGSMTAAMLALSILSIPVMIVHFRLFDRPETDSRPAELPQRFVAAAFLTLPALLSLVIIFDVAEALDLPALPRETAWMSAAGIAAFGAATIIHRFDPARRFIQGTVLTGVTAGACVLAVTVAALAGPEPSPSINFAMEIVPMILLLAVGWWHLKSVDGRDGGTSAPGSTGTEGGRSATAGSAGPD